MLSKSVRINIAEWGCFLLLRAEGGLEGSYLNSGKGGDCADIVSFVANVEII